jgi:hypothetical protein
MSVLNKFKPKYTSNPFVKTLKYPQWGSRCYQGPGWSVRLTTKRMCDPVRRSLQNQASSLLFTIYIIYVVPDAPRLVMGVINRNG